MAWHYHRAVRRGNKYEIVFDIVGGTTNTPSDIGVEYERATLEENLNVTAIVCVQHMQGYHDQRYPEHYATWVLHNSIALLSPVRVDPQ